MHPRREIAGLLFVLGIVAIAFAPALGYGFVYDDLPVVLHNPTLGEPGAWTRAFSENVWAFAPDTAEPRYYRPLFTLWLHAVHGLVGLAPVGWHASTVGLHLLASAALFGFLLRYTKDGFVAGFGTLLWAIHPTRAESVAWVCGLTDPMAAGLGFSAALALLFARPDLAGRDGATRPGLLVLAAGLFGLTLLSKETAIVFCTVPAGLALFGGGSARPLAERAVDAAKLSAPWVLLSLAYLALRAAVLGSVAPDYADYGLGDTLRTQIVLLGLYAEHLAMPLKLALTYPVGAVQEWANLQLLRALPGVFVSLPLFVLAIWKGGRARLLIWLGLGFLLPVLRVDGLQPDMLFQDRYLYLVSACWIPAGIWALQKASSGLPERAGTVIALLVGGIWLALLQVNLPAWANNEAVWQRAVEVHPNSGRAWFNLGVERENQDDLSLAEYCYARASELEPERAIFHFRLAFMLAERGELPSARAHFLEAARLRPEDPMMLYEAGRIERFTGSKDKAMRLLDDAAKAVQGGAAIGGGITMDAIERERRSLRVEMGR